MLLSEMGGKLVDLSKFFLSLLTLRNKTNIAVIEQSHNFQHTHLNNSRDHYSMSETDTITLWK